MSIVNAKMIQHSWHRNGVGGTGFHLVTFSATVDGRERVFNAVRVEQPKDQVGDIACFIIDLVNPHDRPMRGDHFVEVVDEMIEKDGG